MNEALRLVDRWPASTVGVGVAGPHGLVDIRESGPLPWASVTKLLTALATLVAVEEETVSLDDPAGPAGSTVRHLLAHASGLGPDEGVLAAPGERRIYSNAGFEQLASFVSERSAMPFAEYLQGAVLEPLRLTETRLEGSPAHAAVGPMRDLITLGHELLSPTVIARDTLSLARSVAFPGLAGVLPGFGRQDPNDWGLGFELRDGKSPHWTGTRNSPDTFGHFGRSGTFLWVDPVAGVACGCLTDHEFGEWAKGAWPELSNAVLTHS